MTFSSSKYVLGVVVLLFPIVDRSFSTKIFDHLYMEKLLHKNLFENYNKMIIPRFDLTRPVIVTIETSLGEILYILETDGILGTNIYFNIKWMDHQLSWNATEYANVVEIIAPVDSVWLPDLMMLDGMGKDKRLSYQHAFVRIHHTGLIQWWPGGKTKTKCDIDVTKYPFDTQTCNFIIEPWIAHTKLQVLKPPSIVSNPLTGFSTNSQWDVTNVDQNFYNISVGGVEVSRMVFSVSMLRRSQYYLLNILSPIAILSFTSLCCFIIPPGSGEKMSLCVSIFLTFAVYITIISDQMPKSSLTVCFFGLFLFSQFFLSGLIIILSSVVLYVSHKHNEEQEETSKTGEKAEKNGTSTSSLIHSTCNGEISTNMRTVEFLHNNDTVSSRSSLAKKLDMIFLTIVLLLNIVSFSIFAIFVSV